MARDYKKEYAEYHSKPEQKKNRAKRNKAHRNSNCGPGQEVDHKVPLSTGGSNSPSNWRVVSKETNRKKGAKKMSSFDRLRLAVAEKTAALSVEDLGYDSGSRTSNYINMSDPKSQKGSGELGMYREVPIVDSPLENRSFFGIDQGPQPYVLSENASKLREELAKIEGLDVAPEDYTENYDQGPVVEYGHLGYDLGEEKEKLILEALKRGRIASGEKTAAIEGVERLPSGAIRYRGEVFPGFNKPKAAPKGSKHKKRVLAKKGDKVKIVNFGARGYKHNYSAKAKKSYLARSAGIKGKDDKFSANYWSRRELWPKNQKADGSAKKRKKSASLMISGGGAGLMGQLEARKKLEAAGLTDEQIREVSTMGGGALRGIGRAVGYGLGGAVAGGLLGGGIDALAGNYPNKNPVATHLGYGLGALGGGLYGTYRGYQNELELAEEALKQKKTASADEYFDTSALELFIGSVKK